MISWMRKDKETLDTVANNTNSKIIHISFYISYLEKFYILILPRSKKLKLSAPIWPFFSFFRNLEKYQTSKDARLY